MKNTYLITISLSLFLALSCQSNKSEKKESDSMIKTLKSIQSKGILFGHQDDMAYGMNWKYVDGESDVKRVSGDYPAVFGWELGGLERKDSANLDGVPFDKMRDFSIKVNTMGGINTFSWHPFSLVNGENAWNLDTTVVKHIIPGGALHNEFKKQLDIIAAFFLQLKDKDNKPFQFIFRPWHEMGGGWFWWGKDLCTPNEYKRLFTFTINYLKDIKGLTNMVVCYSPNGGYQNAEEYLTYYPGDDIVDMLGVDEYEWPTTQNWIENTQKYLSIMIQVAKEKNKLAAFTETGSENIPDSLWFTQKLGKVLEPDSIAQNISYVLLWRNDPNKHHFFSYDGSPSENDAKAFLAQPGIWLLKDLNRHK